MTPAELKICLLRYRREDGWAVLPDGMPDGIAIRPQGRRWTLEACAALLFGDANFLTKSEIRFIEVKQKGQPVPLKQSLVHSILRGLGFEMVIERRVTSKAKAMPARVGTAS